MKQTVEDLLAGKSFRARIDEQIVFNQLEGNEDAVWSLLLATGYLKVMDTESFAGDRENEPYYTLALTNREVRMMFKNMVRGWFFRGPRSDRCIMILFRRCWTITCG